MRSSSESSTCRLEWRPSRWLAASLIALGALAAVSLWLSALPWPMALIGSTAALMHGARLAQREWRRPPFRLQWQAGEDLAQLNFPHHTESLTGLQVDFRGPLARLGGRDADGRIRRWQWWPDTLPPAARRRLRLAALSQAAAPTTQPSSAA